MWRYPEPVLIFIPANKAVVFLPHKIETENGPRNFQIFLQRLQDIKTDAAKHAFEDGLHFCQCDF